MSGCRQFESGVVELYFYDELEAGERASVAQHVASCAECRQALEELDVIRTALSTRPVVSAPPGGDWTRFMTRLDTAVARDEAARVIPIQHPVAAPRENARAPLTRRAAPYLTMAALLALVTMSVAYVARTGWGRDRSQSQATPVARNGEAATAAAAEPVPVEAAFAALSEQHFERSKLVVLGIASKDPRQARSEDWEYERQLASSLLSDTRLYRLAAEERGLKRIADVMGDLELVLLQTSHGTPSDPEDLEQIQRLIDKRDLVTKMKLVAGI
jgi:hypothetical protein